jgi:hypothetical protein
LDAVSRGPGSIFFALGCVSEKLRPMRSASGYFFSVAAMTSFVNSAHAE